MERNKIINIGDNRLLSLAIYGDPEGVPLLYMHGLPASRLEGQLFHDAAIKAGFKVIAIDRPGYGLSSKVAVTRLVDWGRDIEKLLNIMGIERAYLLGYSGGGPYAISCAYVLGERIAGLALIASLGPVYETKCRNEMPPAGRLGFALGIRSERLVRLAYGDLTARLICLRPNLINYLVASKADSSDRVVLARDDISKILRLSVQEALGQGAAGPVRDFQVVTGAWGINFEDVRCPVQIWHGDKDGVVPLNHARYLTQLLHNATYKVVAAKGHFSLPILQAEEILTSLKHGI